MHCKHKTLFKYFICVAAEALGHDCNKSFMTELFFFFSGGKLTNGGSANWSHGFSERKPRVLKRHVDQDFRLEVLKHFHILFFPTSFINL